MKKSITERLVDGIGQIENTFDPRPPRKSVQQVNSMQQYLLENTRLKIPALIGSECLHGHAGYNSTVFPVPLAMASSWNPELVNQAFTAIGIESRVRGSHEAHTPVLDLGRFRSQALCWLWSSRRRTQLRSDADRNQDAVRRHSASVQSSREDRWCAGHDGIAL
jgi:hypothetical protein